jgi:ribosomal protein S18 acetylase RimI-like enzyme
MSHLLDNMIWNALITGNKSLGVIHGDVAHFYPDIAPFAGMKELTKENSDQLHALLPADRRVAVSYFGELGWDKSKWEILRHMDCCQMVYEQPVSSFVTGQTGLIQALTDEHIPQMLELTRLTKPGPFFERTILFGNYVGIFKNEQLVAMTGQRMHPAPYLEVSAVCTHPDHRGQGYAKALMLYVMKGILDQSFIPFLHVLSDNTGAIRLYESIGFRTRTRLFIDMLKRV